MSNPITQLKLHIFNKAAWGLDSGCFSPAKTKSVCPVSQLVSSFGLKAVRRTLVRTKQPNRDHLKGSESAFKWTMVLFVCVVKANGPTTGFYDSTRDFNMIPKDQVMKSLQEVISLICRRPCVDINTEDGCFSKAVKTAVLYLTLCTTLSTCTSLTPFESV